MRNFGVFNYFPKLGAIPIAMAWCNAVCNKGYAPAISTASQSIETVKFRKGTKPPKCIFSLKHTVRDSHFKRKPNKTPAF